MSIEQTNESQQAPSPETDPPAASQTTETPLTSASTDLGTETSKVETPAAETGTDLGSDETKAEGTAVKEEVIDPYKDFRGPPESGEYADFTLPDGAPVDDVLKAEFLPVVKELGLSQAGAQKLVDYKTKLDQRQSQVWGEHVTELKTRSMADPEIGGTKYVPAVAAAKVAIAKFGTPGLRQMLNAYGVGNHPEMIRFMSKVGAAMGETPALDNGGGAVVNEKPLHEILYSASNNQK